MSDNFASDLISGATQEAQDTGKQISQGASMYSDIVAKSASSDLDEARAQTENLSRDSHIDNMKADTLQRLTEAKLSQQKYEDAKLTHQGVAYQETQKLLNQLSGVNPAYFKTPTVQAMMQRVANLKSQMGIPTTQDDVAAAMKDDGLRAKMQSANSLYLSSDPKDVAQAMEQAKSLGYSFSDMASDEGMKLLRNIQKDKADNENKLQVAEENAKASTNRALITGSAAKDVATIRADAVKSKQTKDMVEKILPNQETELRKEMSSIYKKYDPQITTIKNISTLTRNDQFLDTGVGQIAALDAVVKSATGSGRANLAQYSEFKNSEGPIKGAWNKINAAIGDAKRDGSDQVDLGKFLSRTQLASLQKVGQLLERSQVQALQKEAGPVFNSYKDFKSRADTFGYKTQGSNIFDEDLYNALDSHASAFNFNQSTGQYEKQAASTSPTGKTSGRTSTDILLKDYKLSPQQVSKFISGIKSKGTLDQLNKSSLMSGKKMTQKDYDYIKKRFGVQ